MIRLPRDRLVTILRVAFVLACLMPFAAPRAAATPAPLGSPELWDWLTLTTAHALRKAATSGNDLSAGGREALNRGADGSVGGLHRLGPAWLRRIDVDLSFGADLRPAWRVQARQPVYDGGAREPALELLGAFDHRPNQRSRGWLGLGYHDQLLENRFSVVARGEIEQDWRHPVERYGFETEFRWPWLKLRGKVMNDVLDDRSAPAQIRERLLDGYELEADAGLPLVPWVRLRARHSWHAALEVDGEETARDRYSLLLTPWRPVVMEAGTSGDGGPRRRWFTRLRVTLQL